MALAAQSDLMSDFATVWQAAHNVVYSTTLAAVSTANTLLERHFDPGAVHDLKAAASKRSHHWRSEPGGTGIRGRAGRRVPPVRLARRPRWGKPALPTDTRAELELLDERRFSNGVVHLRYGPL